MENPEAELSGHKPQLAAALRARFDRVIRRWQDSVAKALPRAEELTLAQFRDDLPKLLEEIVEGLRTGGRIAGDELLQEAGGQGGAGEHRPTQFHQNYNLRELLIEYDLLRAAVLIEVSEHLGRALSLEESLALNFRLDIAVRRAMLAFVDHQSRQIRAAAESLKKSMSFLSHDLRGTLNGAVLMIELLRRRLGSEKQFAESLSDLEVMRRSILDTVTTMDRFLKDGV